MSARAEILARIGEIERAPAAPIARTYRHAGELGAAARARLLAERIAEYRAEVREVAARGVAGAIALACEAHGVVRVAVPPGLPHEWRPSGVEAIEDHGLTPRQLDALDGVVTGCTVAVAETGTIVLAGGATEGRRALTLVPDLHICVIGAEQIVELLPEATAVLAPLVADERRPLTYISGPSATSDIELSRVEGVHGPRTLIALIVGEEEQ
ncbi:MAG: lactate utilization protein C [Gaiellaceae bacterium]